MAANKWTDVSVSECWNIHDFYNFTDEKNYCPQFKGLKRKLTGSMCNSTH